MILCSAPLFFFNGLNKVIKTLALSKSGIFQVRRLLAAEYGCSSVALPMARDHDQRFIIPDRSTALLNQALYSKVSVSVCE
jgi:hypothetical protein